MSSREVIILTCESPYHLGGMERFVSTLVSLLQHHGYDARVLHRENSVPINWRDPRSKGQKILLEFLLSYFLGCAARKALHPGVRLVLSNGPVGWYPLNNRIRQAHFYHGTYRGQAEAIRPFISYRGYLKLKWWDAMVLERWSGKGKLCLCNSDQTRDEVQRFFGHNGVTVWCPLDTEHFRPLNQTNCKRVLGLDYERMVGLFVGSTHPMKGFPTVRRLIESFPQVQWVLALRGEFPKDIDQNKVKVFRNASYAELPLLYSAADFSICPSRYEPFGYVVAEALACGTPVIATPGGASRIFLGQTALKKLLIDAPDNLDGFVKAVHIILADPIEWRRIVLEEVRPQVVELIALENWWRRFLEVVGL